MRDNFRLCNGKTATVDISRLVKIDAKCEETTENWFANIHSSGKSLTMYNAKFEEIGTLKPLHDEMGALWAGEFTVDGMKATATFDANAAFISGVLDIQESSKGNYSAVIVDFNGFAGTFQEM